MMAELVQMISEKTSLPPEKAQEVVNVVVNHLK
jgi:nucleoid DNA-binding protein